MIEKKYISNNNDTITYYHKKKGDNILVIILHGWAHSKERWLHFSEIKLSEYSVLLIDLPGFGNSKYQINVKNLTEYSEELFNLFNFLQIDWKRTFLVGHSFGGCICLEIINTFNPSKVVLIDTPIRPIWPALIVKSIKKVANVGFSICLQSKFIIYMLCRLTVGSFKNIDNLMITDAQKMTAKNAVSSLLLLSNINYSSIILNNISKILIIIGEKDIIVPIKQYLFILKNVHIVAKSGHTPFLEFEYLTANEILKYFTDAGEKI